MFALKSADSIVRVKIRGKVIRLKNLDFGGRIMVATEIERQRRSITIALTQVDLEQAIRAYKGQINISCFGRLERTGQFWLLKRSRTHSTH